MSQPKPAQGGMNISRVIWAIAVVLAIFFFDQLTKYLVLQEDVFNAMACLERSGPCGKIELSSVMDLSMVWNRGFSFGMAQSEGLARWGLVIMQFSVSMLFLVWLFKARYRTTAVALSMVIGGALGNVVDRIRFGAVVDFFDFSGPWFGVEFPLPGALSSVESIFTPAYLLDGRLGLGFPYVFNIADAGITIGAILLLVDQFLLKRHDSDAG
ncbi:signal peptidase II [Ponticaulis sp.]|uniref:signal peptidase II n=1 Tax=Ponticaulis sp. TaxID=2020902 RepID=UPI0025E75847|nr:signal peptidase II [Ponticaulis sp.]|tara:strand:- start:18754 stop:19389 length:636 start_codon:yes stop_codon:yes gene_type:complete